MGSPYKVENSQWVPSGPELKQTYQCYMFGQKIPTKLKKINSHRKIFTDQSEVSALPAGYVACLTVHVKRHLSSVNCYNAQD